MYTLVLRRLLWSIPVLLALTLLLFLAVKLVPGDVAIVMAGERANAEKIEAIREHLHLNDPLYVQYGNYIWKLVTQLDFGTSIFHNKPIIEIFASYVPATAELGAMSLFIAIPIGIVMGILAAVFKNRWPDRVASVVSLGGVSMPIFWLALVLMYFFSVVLQWFPTSGRISDAYDPASDSITRFYILDGIILAFKGNGWGFFVDALHHIMLPALALSTIPMAYICRMTRSSFLEVLGQDYIRTARAKGLNPWKVVLKHAFRNASLQIVTITALQAGTIFGGAVITETMFAWPGLGRVLVESISNRDFPMVQSGTLFVGVVFVSFNLLADILYAILDPRVKNAVSGE